MFYLRLYEFNQTFLYRLIKLNFVCPKSRTTLSPQFLKIYIYIYIHTKKRGPKQIYDLEIESGVSGVDREVVSIDEHGDVHT
jgi:hypothetical protein